MEEDRRAGVAKVYATYVFPHYGLPKKVISNRDPQFASNFSRNYAILLRIKQNISSALTIRRPMGRVRELTQSLEQYLRLYCGSQQKGMGILATSSTIHTEFFGQTHPPRNPLSS